MIVTIDIADASEDLLRRAYGDNLSCAIVESLVSEGYRSQKLSRYEVQQILGFDNRWDTEEWLASRGLHMHYSLADLEDDRRTLDKVLGPIKAELTTPLS